MEPFFVTPDKRVMLYHDDCSWLLSQLDSESFSAILTDPPYGIAWKSNWVPPEEQHEVLKGDKELTWMGDFVIECDRLLQHEGSISLVLLVD